MTCEQCEEAYQNNPPCDEWDESSEPAPCHEITRPELSPENLNIFALWQVLNFQARDNSMGFSPLRLEACIMLCFAYGESRDVLNKILLFEQEVYPLILEKIKNAPA